MKLWRTAEPLTAPLSKFQTAIYLAPSQPINIETYEPNGTDPLLAFKRIASAEDALAFADKYGFLGVEETTAAVSAGVMPISEPSFELRPPWMFSGKRNTKAKLPTAQRNASVHLILRQEHGSTRIHSSFDDLRERISNWFCRCSV
jgi:hypothetical protein